MPKTLLVDARMVNGSNKPYYRPKDCTANDKDAEIGLTGRSIVATGHKKSYNRQQ